MSVEFKDIENLKSIFEYIKILSDDGLSSNYINKVTELLNYSKQYFRHLILKGSFPELYRLSINKNIIKENKRLTKISDLKYPPSDKITTYGRCNLPRQSVLYASLIKPTILNELKPKFGEIVTYSKWKVKDNQTMFYCPIFMNQPKNGTFNPRTKEISDYFEKTITVYSNNEKEFIRYLTQFIADAFAKRVTTKNDLEYFLSAFFSNIIFNEMNTGKVEAIYYPSVQEDLAFENIAIKPETFDNKYELKEVSDSVIIKSIHDGNGTYLMHGISSTTKFDFANDKVIWNQDQSEYLKQIDRIEKEHNIKI